MLLFLLDVVVVLGVSVCVCVTFFLAAVRLRFF